MNKKRRSALAGIAILAIAAAIMIAIAISFQPRTVLANSEQPVSTPNIDIVATQATLSANATATQMPYPPVQYPLVQKVNGIKIEVTGTSNEGNFFAVDVCYDLPNNKGEFQVGGQTPNYITLSTSGEIIPVYGITIMGDLQKDSNGKYIQRCDRLEFPISPATSLDKLTLTISRMATSPAEILDCVRAQKKLDDAKQKIKIKCSENKNGLGGGFSVTEKPAEIDDATAESIAVDAFIEVMEGPWMFALN